MLRFHTLGTFELLEGDPPAMRLVPIQPKRLALLAYLALAQPRGFHRRDTLLALFWPELSEEEARRALRQALHHLRRALGQGPIETRTDDQVRLRDGSLWCDALAFEDAVAQGHPREALALYRNAFLAGVHLADVSVELEEWIARTRSQFHRAAGEAAIELSRQDEQAGEIAAAARVAQTAWDLDPDDESRARRLMRLLERRGERAQALQVYDRLAHRLASEYGTVPCPETTALARSFREADRPDPPSAPGAALDVRTARVPSAAEGRLPLRLRWMAGALLLLTVVGAAFVLVPARSEAPTLLSTGGLVAGSRLIVADFENHSRDSLLPDVVTATLRLALSQSSGIRVLSPSAVRAARSRMQDPDPTTPLADSMAQLLAAREGLGLVLRGDVSSLGSGIAISAQLVSPATGAPLATVRATAADSTRLLETIDRLAHALRKHVGDSARALRASPPLHRITTASLPALRRWSEAMTAMHLYGDRQKARLLLEEAVALDTSFATAWRALCVLYGSLGPAHAMADAATRAYRHRHRLTERERHLVTAEYHTTVTGDFRRAFAAYDSQLTATPNDAGILGAAAYLHFRLREFEPAERLYRRALDQDSTSTPLYFGLIESRINLGRLDEARAALAAFRDRFPDNPFAEWEEIYLAVAAGKPDSAAVHARRLQALAPGDADHRGEALRTLANVALLRRRFGEARRYHREAMSVYEGNGDLAGYFTEVLSLATAEAALAARPDAARKAVGGALERHPLESLPPGARPYARLGVLFAELGDLERAAEMQAALERHGLDRGRFAEAEWRRLRGTILMSRGRYFEAQQQLRLAAQQDECALCSLPALARSYELGGRPDSAIAVYERYLRTPWMKRLELDAVEREAVTARLQALRGTRDFSGE